MLYIELDFASFGIWMLCFWDLRVALLGFGCRAFGTWMLRFWVLDVALLEFECCAFTEVRATAPQTCHHQDHSFIRPSECHWVGPMGFFGSENMG